MDVDQATNFLVCSMLTGFGFIVVAAVVVIINNIFSKFWKPIIWSNMLPNEMYPPRYVEVDDSKQNK